MECVTNSNLSQLVDQKREDPEHQYDFFDANAGIEVREQRNTEQCEKCQVGKLANKAATTKLSFRHLSIQK